MRWQSDEELIAALSRSLAHPTRTPSEVELDEFRRVLAQALPERRRSLQGILARPWPIALAGVLAVSGSSIAAAAAGVSLPSPLRSAAVALGLPVDDSSVAVTKGEIVALSRAVTKGNRTEVSRLRNELASQLRILSAADLKKVKQSAENVLNSASQLLSRTSVVLPAAGATHQLFPTSTPSPSVGGNSDDSHKTRQPVTPKSVSRVDGDHSGDSGAGSDDNDKSGQSSGSSTANDAGPHGDDTSSSSSDISNNSSSNGGSGQSSRSGKGSTEVSGSGQSDHDTNAATTPSSTSPTNNSGRDQSTTRSANSSDSTAGRDGASGDTSRSTSSTTTTSPSSSSDGKRSGDTNGTSGTSSSGGGNH